MIASLQTWIGRTVILIGILITGIGVYAFLRLKSFYARLVITSKVEAMGFTTVVIGAMILAGFGLAAVKLAVILFFELLTVAVSAHAIARSAWNSGYVLPPARPPEPSDD